MKIVTPGPRPKQASRCASCGGAVTSSALYCYRCSAAQLASVKLVVPMAKAARAS